MKVSEILIRKIEVGEHEQRVDQQDPETAELAASVKRIGVLNPLTVFDAGGTYILVAGHRRLEAAKLAGLDSVPCVVRPKSESDAAEVAFAENFFRKNLSSVELACAIKDCLQKSHMTEQAVASGFHRTVHWVQQMSAIADWPDDILQAMHGAGLSISAAANLVQITDETYRKFLVDQAVGNGATARSTAAWLQAYQTMLPADEAVQAPPVPVGTVQAPMVPQAPCLCCAQLFKVNEMSHVPVCGACIQLLRTVGSAGVDQNVG